jgi:hypothetical protein
MNVIGELVLELSPANGKVVARIFAPEERIPGELWVCRFEIGEPFKVAGDMKAQPASSLLLLRCSACLRLCMVLPNTGPVTSESLENLAAT